MAASTITVTVDKIDSTLNSLILYGSFAFAAGDYAPNGIVANFATATGPGGVPIPVSDAPVDVQIFSQPLLASGTTGMFAYGWLKGTTAALGQVQVFTGAAAQSALTELSTGALPAGVVADRIRFVAVFNRI